MTKTGNPCTRCDGSGIEPDALELALRELRAEIDKCARVVPLGPVAYRKLADVEEWARRQSVVAWALRALLAEADPDAKPGPGTHLITRTLSRETLAEARSALEALR